MRETAPGAKPKVVKPRKLETTVHDLFFLKRRALYHIPASGATAFFRHGVFPAFHPMGKASLARTGNNLRRVIRIILTAILSCRIM